MDEQMPSHTFTCIRHAHTNHKGSAEHIKLSLQLSTMQSSNEQNHPRNRTHEDALVLSASVLRVPRVSFQHSGAFGVVDDELHPIGPRDDHGIVSRRPHLLARPLVIGSLQFHYPPHADRQLDDPPRPCTGLAVGVLDALGSIEPLPGIAIRATLADVDAIFLTRLGRLLAGLMIDDEAVRALGRAVVGIGRVAFLAVVHGVVSLTIRRLAPRSPPRLLELADSRAKAPDGGFVLLVAISMVVQHVV
mmetsp:Transcript_1561/g.3399  ORF Transcript_1561/g.3399 Transcript_1561/m.3399 type:complete len:247 (-) Transcript_1561:178-918(-)